MSRRLQLWSFSFLSTDGAVIYFFPKFKLLLQKSLIFEALRVYWKHLQIFKIGAQNSHVPSWIARCGTCDVFVMCMLWWCACTSQRYYLVYLHLVFGRERSGCIVAYEVRNCRVFLQTAKSSISSPLSDQWPALTNCDLNVSWTHKKHIFLWISIRSFFCEISQFLPLADGWEYLPRPCSLSFINSILFYSTPCMYCVHLVNQLLTWMSKVQYSNHLFFVIRISRKCTESLLLCTSNLITFLWTPFT